MTALSILSRVDPYLIKILGEVKPTPSGAEYRFNCPECANHGHTPDTNFRLYVNITKGKYHCIRCRQFYGSLEYLYGTEFKPAVDWSRWEGIRRRLLGETVDAECGVTTTVADFLEEYTRPSMDIYSDVFEYMVSRLQGLPDRELEADGPWAKVFRQGKGKYWSRLFLIDWYRGEPRYWNARSTLAKARAKYLNPPIPRYNLIFNQEQVERRAPADITVNEGMLSAIHSGMNSIATYGRVLTDAQLHIIHRLKTTRFYFVAESDPDGWTDAWNSARLLQGLSKEVFITPMSKGDDPASMGRDAFTQHKHTNSVECTIRNKVFSSLSL